MISKQGKKIMPIILLLSWLLLTILVFVFGPYKYKINNSFLFYTYLFIVNVSLFLGYMRGQKSYGRKCKIKINYIKFVQTSIIISFIYLIIKLILTSGGDLANVFTTFKDASESYMKRTTNHPNLFSYIDIFILPVTIIAITNGIFSSKKLNRGYRYCVYIMIIYSIASSIGSGTRAGIVGIVLIVTAAFLLGIYKKNIIIKARHKIFLFLMAMIFFMGFFAYIGLLTESRSVYQPINPLTKKIPDKNFVLFKILPPQSHPAINNISFYLAHSYYRLNQAFDLPYNGIGFGLSNSYFIMDNIQELTGWTGPKNISYGLRLDMKQNGFFGNYWSTFYAWIASDFTFPGTIIIVYIIGYFFSLALRDSLLSPNPLSVAVFCILFGFIFHFAFNNPLQDGSGITINLGITAIWLFSRNRNLTV